MRSSKLIDGVVWDGKDPAKYADSFKVQGQRGLNDLQEPTMVSAVFHSPPQAACDAAPAECRAPSPAARRPQARRADAARRAHAARAVDWRALAGSRCCRRWSAWRCWSASGRWRRSKGGSASRRPAETFEAAREAVRRSVLPQGPERPGHRLEHPVLAAARRHRLRPGGAGRHPAGLHDRPLRVPQPHGLAADQPAEAGVAAGLAADRPAGVQGRQPGGDLDHLHLLASGR